MTDNLTDAEYVLALIDTTFETVPEVKWHHERMRAIATRLAATPSQAPAEPLSDEQMRAAISRAADINAIDVTHTELRISRAIEAAVRAQAPAASPPAVHSVGAGEPVPLPNFMRAADMLEGYVNALKTLGSEHFEAHYYMPEIEAMSEELIAYARATLASTGASPASVPREDFDKMSADLTRAKNLLVRLYDKHPDARAQIEGSTGNWFAWGQDRDRAASTGGAKP